MVVQISSFILLTRASGHQLVRLMII